MKTKTSNRLITILAAVLLLSLAGNVIQWKSARNQDDFRIAQNLAFQAAIENSRSTAQSYADSVNELAVRLALTRDSVKVAQNARIAEIRAYRKTISELRKPIAVLIDTVPDLTAFVQAQDSVISMQDSLIQSMETAHSAQLVDMDEIIRLQRAELAQQMAITASFEQELAAELKQSANDIKKQRNGKRFWQVTAGIVTGIALYIAVIK